MVAVFHEGPARLCPGQTIREGGEAVAERSEFGDAPAGVRISQIVERYPQLVHTHLPQGQQGVVVADGLAPETVETPGRGNVGALAPWLAQVEADAAPTRPEGMNGRRWRRPFLFTCAAEGADDMQEMPGFVHVDDAIAKFRGVVAALFEAGRRAKELVVVVAQETRRRKDVHACPVMTIEEEVVHVACKLRLHPMTRKQPEQP